MSINKFLFSIALTFVLGLNVVIYPGYIGDVNARTEQLADSNNNNLVMSMEAPDDWNSGIISQTVANLDWRLNGLDAINDDLSAFFIVMNTPSVVNIALPLGQKTGIISLLLSQYVTINGESDLTLSDGSSAHRYSISITSDQLHRLKAPIDKGFEGVIITTKQQGTTYFIIYASELGKMSQFESVFQDILKSVKFGSVSFSGLANPSFTTPPSEKAILMESGNMSPATQSQPQTSSSDSSNQIQNRDDIPGYDTQIMENDSNLSNLENTCLATPTPPGC